LQALDVDLEHRVARVEAAVRGQRLNEALSGTGLTSLPGSSGDPSVVGYTLGGGLSWFGRKYGLAAHRIRAAELVVPGGEHVRVTASSDADLFWALRGSGGDFGIVTALELDLLPAEHIYGGRLLWNVDHVPAVLAAFAEATTLAPDELTMWVNLLNLPDFEFIPEPLRGRWTIAVDLTYLGDAAQAEALLTGLRDAAPLLAGSLDTVPLANLADITAEPTEPTPSMDAAWLLNAFDAPVIETLLAAVVPGRRSPLSVVQLRHLGGALSRPADDPGAAGHIAEPYGMVCVGSVPVPQLAEALASTLAQVGRAMAGHSSGRTPLNSGDDAAAIYPPAVLGRLRRIKQSRDPNGVIRGNRPVVPIR
jgi:FAD/FMN-containing dehydrogenase